MCSAYRFLLVLVLLCTGGAAVAGTPELRVCADPNNMPFSDSQQRGFENVLAQLVARDLGMKLTYFWYPQRERFFRKTLDASVCDLVMSVPSKFEQALPTIPYYRSTYVFISRRDRHLRIKSFDEPALRKLKIGVHVAGDDNLPPAAALASRGMVRNVRGYSIYGEDLFKGDPSANLLRAVAQNDIDLAVAWGPLAGYFATHASIPLDVVPVCARPADRKTAFEFSISMGVRKGDQHLQRRLNDLIQRRGPEIRRILRSYGVPMIPSAPSGKCD